MTPEDEEKGEEQENKIPSFLTPNPSGSGFIIQQADVPELLDQDITWGLNSFKSTTPKRGDMFVDVENDEFLVCFNDGTWVTIAEGSGSVLKVEFSDEQLGGSDIVTLNFGLGFDGTEAPNTQINITLDHSELSFPAWSDTGITGAELEDLSDGGFTTIHKHAAVSVDGGIYHADYLIDSNYAGGEGDSILTAGDSPVIVYTTVQAAISAGATAGGDISIYVAQGANSGVYDEDLTVSGYGSGDHLYITGEGEELVFLGQNSANAVALTHSDTNILTLSGLTLRGGVSGFSLTTASGSNKEIRCEGVIFRQDIKASLGAGSFFRRCLIDVGYDIATSFGSTAVFFTDCLFSGISTWASGEITRVFFDNCRWDTGAYIVATETDMNRISFSNCELQTSATNNWMHINGTTNSINGVTFSNCMWLTAKATTGSIYIQSMNSGAGAAMSFTGCSFDPGADPFIKSDEPDHFECSIVGCSTDSSSPLVVGTFHDSVFGPNTHPDFDINITGGARNLYIGTKATLTGETGTVKSTDDTHAPAAHDYDIHTGGVPFAEVEYDDATSDPLPVDSTVTADGVEASAARKDHRHFATAATVTVQGIIELASAGEATTGAAGVLAMTPSVQAPLAQNFTWTYEGTETGIADAYIITLSSTVLALTEGQQFQFTAANANTGASTLQVEGLVAKTIKKHHDQDLASGDIEAGAIVVCQYDGTNFQMISHLGNTPTAGAHGISSHTEHAADKLLYTDNSGDEQELSLAADGNVLLSKGTTTAPAFGKVALTADVEGVLPEANLPNASTSAEGVVELATTAEINTGTDALKSMVPDLFVASNHAERVVGILVSDPDGDAITTGDTKALFRIPSSMTGMELVEANACLTTVSSSGAVGIQIAKSSRTNATTRTASVNMLTTPIDIDVSEFDSLDGLAEAIATDGKEDVVTGDQIRIDIDGAGTGAKGLYVELIFRTK